MYKPACMLYVANCYLIVATPMDNIELLRQDVDIHPKELGMICLVMGNYETSLYCD
jgi:hypothetical protein